MRFDWRKWAFLAVPAVGVLELGMHVWQTTLGVVPEADWKAAREVVTKKAQPSDLIVFAPTWTDPLGREFLKDDLATLEREARPDESRFPRAIELSIRGKHRAELAGWRSVGKEKVGAITITTLENPAPVTLSDDLLAHAALGSMSVERVDGDRASPCPWSRGAPQAGSLGAGPTIPGDTFVCPGGGFLGVSVIFAMDNTPRRCFFAPPLGGPSVMRVRFANVLFGQVLHGHHALAQFAERSRTGTPITLLFRAEGQSLGKVVHQDGDGWKPFELDTRDLAGKRGELIAEITTSSGGGQRHYCFEADTR